MIRPEVLDALLAAGATAEMIVAAVKADAAIEDARLENKRAGNAERQRRKRERDSGQADDSNAMSRVTGVTTRDERDAPFLDKESFPQTPFKEINPSPGVCIAPARERDFSEEIREAWNAMAARTGLSTVAKLNPSRKAKIRSRIAEHGVDQFTEAIAAIERSPFCRGDSANGWRADFDFLLQPKSFIKLIEGSYDRAKPNSGTAGSPRNADASDNPYVAAFREISACG